MNTTLPQNQQKDLQEVANLVGQTPVMLLPAPFSDENVKIYAKLEWKQLGGSVKARAAYHIIKNALETGELHEGKVLLDASSGNTAIAYASLGAHLGIRVRICLPENASKKRKSMLQLLGAEITYTSPLEGTDGAQEIAHQMKNAEPDRFYYADQYNNPANLKAHYLTTGPEIKEQLPGITHFVCGLGTTGSFTGTSSYFKNHAPHVKCISLQPDSPMHGLEGWKHLETAKIPGIYNTENTERNYTVDSQRAIGMIPEIAKRTGLLLSPSSAANLLGSLQVKRDLERGIIVTLFPDDLLKYDEILKQIEL